MSTRALGRLLLLLLPLAACEYPTATLPAGAQRFSPPAVYRQWWALTEACSGAHGSFDAVQWYRIPDASQLQLPDGSWANGMWVPDGNRIVIAAGTDGLYAGELVRHEMLHALLHDGGHPRDEFIGRCGGVVVCITWCDAGSAAAPPPDPAAVPMDPAALEIGVDVTTVPATPPDSEPYVMMVVSARNPSHQPWQIRLPPSGDAGPPSSFSYRLQSWDVGTTWYDMRADAPEVTRFAAGETKRFIFDFWVRPGGMRFDLAPGTWTFHGAYGDVWSPVAPSVKLEP